MFIEKIEWDISYLKIAEVLAEKSKCSAKKVGCVVVKDQNIISSGVNGTPKGFVNCNELWCKNDEGLWTSLDGNILENQSSHKEWSLKFEIHAEMNAISKLARSTSSAEGATLYCNYCPCIQCAKNIIPTGITRVIYINDFDDSDIVTEFLSKNNIEVIKMNPNN